MQGRYINNTNRFTLYQRYNYAFRNLYSANVDRTPTKAEPNSIFYFSANSKGVATVDWGDGNVDTFDFIQKQGSGYICAFRSLKSNSFTGSTNDWVFGKDINGNPIIPYDNHYYIDDNIDVDRKIVITCTNNIDTLTSSGSTWVGFPLIECNTMSILNIAYTQNIKEIPFDRIEKMTGLKRLSLSYLGSRMQVIPTGVFELSNLDYLDFSGIFDLSNPDSSNLRLVSQLTKLRTLNLGGCNITKYIRQFNDLPLLGTLSVSSGNNNAPSYDEVSQINRNLAYYYNVYSTGTTRSEWDNLSGKGCDKIKSLDCWDSQALRIDTLPFYITEMRSINLFNMGQALRTQERADTFVNTFY